MFSGGASCTPAVASWHTELPVECYPHLLERLKEDTLSRTIDVSQLSVLTIIELTTSQSMLFSDAWTCTSCNRGDVTARFYTDSWPEFSVLVCEQISPRMTPVSTCHAIYTMMGGGRQDHNGMCKKCTLQIAAACYFLGLCCNPVPQ